MSSSASAWAARRHVLGVVTKPLLLCRMKSSTLMLNVPSVIRLSTVTSHLHVLVAGLGIVALLVVGEADLAAA